MFILEQWYCNKNRFSFILHVIAKVYTACPWTLLPACGTSHWPMCPPTYPWTIVSTCRTSHIYPWNLTLTCGSFHLPYAEPTTYVWPLPSTPIYNCNNSCLPVKTPIYPHGTSHLFMKPPTCGTTHLPPPNWPLICGPSHLTVEPHFFVHIKRKCI